MGTFTLSIETTPGQSFQYGFHLGTIEHTAREIAEEKYWARVHNNLQVVTVALVRDNKLFDCFDGKWMNDPQWL